MPEQDRAMNKGPDGQADSVIPDSGVCYGCLFCVTGHEDEVAGQLRVRWPELRVINPVRQHYYRKSGAYTIVEDRMFPGYMFFSTNDVDFPVNQIERMEGILRLLRYDNEEWTLRGDDREIVEELFKFNGVIGFSKGTFVDGRLHISQGFLKRYERAICKVDKRHKTAKISIKLNNRLIDLWLGYDEEEPSVSEETAGVEK